MLRKKILTSLLGISLLLGSTMPTFANDINVSRISGNNRYETSLNICTSTFTSVPYAIIASGEIFPDALASGALSSQEGLPIILTKMNELPEGAIQKLKTINVENVFIVGGQNSVSLGVEQTLKGQSFNVERLAGTNRADTAIEVSNKRHYFFSKKFERDLDEGEFIPIGDFYAGVNGFNFPDALVASPYVGMLGGQSKNDLITQLTLNMSKHNQDVPYSLVIGGVNSVPKVDYNSSEQRISGKNRYQTAKLVADQYTRTLKLKPSTVILANGNDYPDALSAAQLVRSNNAPILLTESNKLNEYARNYIKENSIKKVIIVGGENSVSNKIIDELNNL